MVAEHVGASRSAFGTLDHSPVAVCSLTKAAAAEAAGRTGLTRNVVGTLHAFAMRYLGNPGVATDKKNIGDFNDRYPHFALSPESGGGGDSAYDTVKGRGGAGDEAMASYTLNRNRIVPRERWGARIQAFAKVWEDWKDENELVDFTDAIERATEHGVPSPGTHLFVDEAQDLSALERRMVRVMGRTAKSVTAVGDPDQALYVWRGANPAMFLDESRRSVLGQSYRVPQAAHALAVKIARELTSYSNAEYKPTDEPGEVVRHPGGYTTPEALLPFIDSKLGRGESVMILGTCDFHVTPTVQVLRKRGYPFANPWRRKNGAWNPLGGGVGVGCARRLADLLHIDRDLAGDDMGGWTAQMIARWMEPVRIDGNLKHGEKTRASRDATAMAEDYIDAATVLDERFVPGSRIADTLRALLDDDGSDPARRKSLRLAAAAAWVAALPARSSRIGDYLLRVLSRCDPVAIVDEPMLYVGTAHSVKGGEADHVIVYPDISYAASRCDDPDSMLRTLYVAVTRARKSVGFTRSGGNLHAHVDRWL